MNDAERLSDAELRNELKRMGVTELGPVNAATRGAYLKKLEKLLKEREAIEDSPAATKQPTKRRVSKGRRPTAERRSGRDSPDDARSGRPSEVENASVEFDARPKTSKIPGEANISVSAASSVREPGAPSESPFSRLDADNPPSSSILPEPRVVGFEPNFRRREIGLPASHNSNSSPVADASSLRATTTTTTSRIDVSEARLLEPRRREPASRNRDWDASGAVGRLRDSLEDENSWLTKYSLDSSSRVRRRFEENVDHSDKLFRGRDRSVKDGNFNFRRSIPPSEPPSADSTGRFSSSVFARPAPKTRGSPFDALSGSLGKFREFFHDAILASKLLVANYRDRFIGLFRRKYPKKLPPKEKGCLDRYRSSNNKCNAELNFGREKPQVYRKRRFLTLDHETSRHILLALVIFLMFLIVGYFSTVYRDHIRRTVYFFYGAGVDTAAFVYRNMILPVLAIISAFGFAYGIFLYKRYKWHKVAEEQRQIFEMVEEIIAMLKKHHEDCLANGNRQPYLAVPHVRDMLIPPHRRKELYPIWDKAVEYLNENESRVRTENQCISGEEFMVWRWLQIACQHKQEEKVWQGHAFPEEEVECNAPKFAYFECLKLRGLFDPAVEDEEDWPEHIQDAILEKLGPTIQVLHLAVDLKSKDGCVYVKMANNAQAGEAYKILNGSWFNGRLVSVKYLRPERYHERFPDAVRAFVPLRVKKARNSLSGGFR